MLTVYCTVRMFKACALCIDTRVYNFQSFGHRGEKAKVFPDSEYVSRDVKEHIRLQKAKICDSFNTL